MRAASWLMWMALVMAVACGDAGDADSPDDGAAPSTAGRGGVSGGSAGSGGRASMGAGDAGASGAAGSAMSGAGGARGTAGTGGSSGAGSGGAGGGEPNGGGAGGASADAGAGGVGMGGAMTFDPADHCEPGTYVPGEQFGFSNEPDHATTCNDADHFAAAEAGVIEGTPEVRVFIRDVELATPMTAGEPYAMSFEIDFEGLDGAMGLELWGTTARCGMGQTATMLSETVLASDKQTVCAEVTPGEAYTHLLLVLRDQDDVNPDGRQSSTFAGATFCAEGTCP